MDISEEVYDVERELLKLIIKRLEESKIDVQKARLLAADFLKQLPIADQQDLLNKLKQLGQEHAEIQQIYVTELGKVSDQKREEALNKMRDHIQQGQIEHAISIANGLSVE